MQANSKTAIGLVVAAGGLLILGVALYGSTKTDEVGVETSSDQVAQIQSSAVDELTLEELREALKRERNTALALTEIREELARERKARLALNTEIIELWAQLAEILTLYDPAQHGAVSESSETASKADLESEFAELWFDEQALIDQGMSVSEVKRLRARFDEVELEKLTARDRAARDGWSSSSRHSQELRDIQTRYREEIGDEDYDRVLYASGRKNRVRVSDLLGGSAAANSGVRVGDVIYSYAGRRVFDPSSLYVMTTQGEADEYVQIVVIRDNRPFRLTTVRGPLGTKLAHTSTAPGY